MKEHQNLEPIMEKVISSDDFIEKLNGILDKAEEKFLKKYKRYPDLESEEDYLLLADFLDFSNQYSSFKDFNGILSNTGISRIDQTRQGLIKHDLGNLVIKRFIKRKGWFAGEEQEKILNAIFGDRDYNPPKEEYLTRINSINDLINNQIPFPNNWDEFIQEIEKINKACYLNKFSKDEDIYSKVSQKICSHLINPLSQRRDLKKIKSWADLMGEWKFRLPPSH